jgi:hypothetical protein
MNRAHLIAYMIGTSIALSGCIDYGPVDKTVLTNDIPGTLASAIRQELLPGEKVISITERRHRGRIAGYFVKVKNTDTGTLELMFCRHSTGQLLRDHSDQLPKPPG